MFFVFIGLIIFLSVLSFIIYKKIIFEIRLCLSKLDEIQHCIVNKLKGDS